MNLKPNMLVLVSLRSNGVDGGERSYIGECMSYPTPEQTVVVRRVPGHPGTLEELPIKTLTFPARPYRFVHYAIVAPINDKFGALPFPEDMLARCTASEVNFQLVAGRAQHTTKLYGSELWIARAGVREQSGSAYNWYVDRWQSFGWTCVPQKSEAI